MIKEHQRVVLKSPVSDKGLEAGDVGTVVHVYRDGEAYEVEFVALDGHTVAVATLEGSELRPVSPREIPHARELVAA
jgi:DNA polymerase III sliding clamp (beta) subunit (PCNA family)